ncbi:MULTISPECIES: phage tail terminator family protein [unclassified Sedimentibacter]|uniref:phage tail terminator family protein n=1 Tax=unclassified Sedimentibacter TaxID=2649220 RepID=UPI0027E13070|nr:hypothetical protein [Sedimentibacter sp. MB35-C1]WMJ78499.1 hypothetical protein RBQ61_06140 [Sedimentibacter sp. MB35-C1]
MIENLKQSIVDKLIELYPEYAVYDEEMPQGTNEKSFFIAITGQDYGKRFNNKFKSSVSFDIAYFSNEEAGKIKADCQNVQISLLRNFDSAGIYRVLNKKAAITDNVLHFTFNVTFYEIREEISDKMQRQQTNTNN